MLLQGSCWSVANHDGGAVMADGEAAAGGGEQAARGAALERAYVHDVYEQVCRNIFAVGKQHINNPACP